MSCVDLVCKDELKSHRSRKAHTAEDNASSIKVCCMSEMRPLHDWQMHYTHVHKAASISLSKLRFCSSAKAQSLCRATVALLWRRLDNTHQLKLICCLREAWDKLLYWHIKRHWRRCAHCLLRLLTLPDLLSWWFCFWNSLSGWDSLLQDNLIGECDISWELQSKTIEKTVCVRMVQVCAQVCNSFTLMVWSIESFAAPKSKLLQANPIGSYTWQESHSETASLGAWRLCELLISFTTDRKTKMHTENYISHCCAWAHHIQFCRWSDNTQMVWQVFRIGTTLGEAVGVLTTT